MNRPKVKARLAVLLRRLHEWDETDEIYPSQRDSKAEELLLDIKQCLESILLYDNQ